MTRSRQSYIGHQCEECEDELATGGATVITVLVGPIQFKDHATSRLLSTRTGWAATLVEDDNDPYDAGVVVGA